MKNSAAAIAGLMALAFAGSSHATTFFGPASAGIAIVGAPSVTLGGGAGTESYGDLAILFGTSGSLTSATGSGAVSGALDFSQTVGSVLTESVPDFLTFADTSGGVFEFSVASVETMSFSNTAPSTSVALYILGTAGDIKLGLAPAPTSVTLTVNRTGLSPYSASASIAAPPSGAVPEPTIWAMMVAGLGLMGAVMRIRRANILPSV